MRNTVPSNTLPPYLLPVEIIRSLAKAFDIKFSKKTLDDHAHNIYFDYRKINQYIDDEIYIKLDQFISHDIAVLISNSIKQVIDLYLKKGVAEIGLVGVVREDSVPLLLETYFSNLVAQFMNDVHREVNGPTALDLLKGQDKGRSVAVVLDWLARNEPNWNQFVSTLTKEHKDRIASWYRGDDLPSSQSIKILSSWSEYNIDWSLVKTLLVIGRVIDYYRASSIGSLAVEASVKAIKKPYTYEDFRSKLLSTLKNNIREIEDILPFTEEVSEKLKRTAKKNFNEKEVLFKKITLIRDQSSCSINYQRNSYWADWYMARWYIYAGDLKSACEFYKKSFEKCIYTIGRDQEVIINEALIIAAVQNKPDVTFLKKLKNSLITFGYDIPSSIQKDSNMANAASEFIEEWEIERWRSGFKHAFPKEGFFEDVNYDAMEYSTGIITNLESIKPDYRNVNRTIKVGEELKRKMPQIVWFAMTYQVDIVKKLLDKGANVNCASEVGDTPILMSLRLLDVTCPEDKPLDDELFYLLTEYPHEQGVLNTPTAQKRKLPLFSAIESGRPEIVKKLLDMGADPNGRGNTELHTALNFCLQLIIKRKKPEKYRAYLEEGFGNSDDPVVLDSIRRYIGSMSGYTLEAQKRYIQDMKTDGVYQQFLSICIDHTYDKFIKKMSLPNLREMAVLLLEYGADSNAVQTWPVNGYTPLMFAAEIDEKNLFESMLLKNGDPYISCINPMDGNKVNCWEIAKSFSSKSVLEVLDSTPSSIT